MYAIADVRYRATYM